MQDAAQDSSSCLEDPCKPLDEKITEETSDCSAEDNEVKRTVVLLEIEKSTNSGHHVQESQSMENTTNSSSSKNSNLGNHRKEVKDTEHGKEVTDYLELVQFSQNVEDSSNFISTQNLSLMPVAGNSKQGDHHDEIRREILAPENELIKGSKQLEQVSHAEKILSQDLTDYTCMDDDGKQGELDDRQVDVLQANVENESSATLTQNSIPFVQEDCGIEQTDLDLDHNEGKMDVSYAKVEHATDTPKSATELEDRQVCLETDQVLSNESSSGATEVDIGPVNKPVDYQAGAPSLEDGVLSEVVSETSKAGACPIDDPCSEDPQGVADRLFENYWGGS